MVFWRRGRSARSSVRRRKDVAGTVPKKLRRGRPGFERR
jgi:hypothetical protein